MSFQNQVTFEEKKTSEETTSMQKDEIRGSQLKLKKFLLDVSYPPHFLVGKVKIHMQNYLVVTHLWFR